MQTRCNRLIYRSVTIAVIAVLVAVTAGIPDLGFSSAYAQSPQGTITVIGEGKVRIKPDMAQVTIGVEVIKPTVKEASTETSRIMNDVLAALKKLGLAETDIQTSSISVWLERPYLPDGTQGEPVYHVSNSVNANIRNLDKLGDVLDATMAAGANNIYGVTFSLSDTSKVEAEARQKAVENARAKAEELAQLTNLALGEVISVSEVIGGGGSGYYNSLQSAAMGMGGGGPVSPGELELTMQLQVVYSVVQ
jgi:uncharacterized protein YggE